MCARAHADAHPCLYVCVFLCPYGRRGRRRRECGGGGAHGSGTCVAAAAVSRLVEGAPCKPCNVRWYTRHTAWCPRHATATLVTQYVPNCEVQIELGRIVEHPATPHRPAVAELHPAWARAHVGCHASCCASQRRAPPRAALVRVLRCNGALPRCIATLRCAAALAAAARWARGPGRGLCADGCEGGARGNR
jgi:hypothetical protein